MVSGLPFLVLYIHRSYMSQQLGGSSRQGSSTGPAWHAVPARRRCCRSPRRAEPTRSAPWQHHGREVFCYYVCHMQGTHGFISDTARASLLIWTHPEPFQVVLPRVFSPHAAVWQGDPLRGRAAALSHTFLRAIHKSWCCGVSPTAAPAVLLPHPALSPPRRATAVAAWPAPPRATAWPGSPCTSLSRPSSLRQQATAGFRVTGRFSLMPANSHEATDKQVARAGAAKQKEPSPPQADGRPRQGAVDSCPSRVTDAGLGCLGVGLFIFVRKRKKKKKDREICSCARSTRTSAGGDTLVTP